MVHPYNAKEFLKESLSQNGLDNKDSDLLMKLLKLIMEEAEVNKSRKKKVDTVLAGYDFKDFEKLV